MYTMMRVQDFFIFLPAPRTTIFAGSTRSIEVAYYTIMSTSEFKDQHMVDDKSYAPPSNVRTRKACFIYKGLTISRLSTFALR